MSELIRTVNVQCPVSQAKMHLDHFFDEHVVAKDEADGAKSATLTLKAPGFPGGATLQHDVNVRLLRHKRPVDAFDTIDVNWEVPDSTMYPRFAGTLSVEANDDYNTFTLALRGAYTPPAGIVGQVFDAVVGHRIAEATADHLLGEMRDSIEHSFHRVEAAKRTDPTQPVQ